MARADRGPARRARAARAPGARRARRSRLPLARVLEGGTWAAGRVAGTALARRRAAAAHRERRHRLLDCALRHDKNARASRHRMSNVHLVDHPLVQHKLTLMRRKDARTDSFRRLLNEISMLLAYEVTRDMPLQDIEIETPLATMHRQGHRRQEAGARLDPARRHRHPRRHARASFPGARVGHIGLYRDPKTLTAVEYYFKMPGEHARARRDRRRPDARHRQLGRRRGRPAEGSCGRSRSSSSAC